MSEEPNRIVIIAFQGTLVAVLSIGAGLLGFVAMDTTNRYNTAMTGERGSGGIMNTIRTVATGTRK